MLLLSFTGQTEKDGYGYGVAGASDNHLCRGFQCHFKSGLFKDDDPFSLKTLLRSNNAAFQDS